MLVAYNPFTAKAPPTKDAHDTRRRRFNVEKQTYSATLNNYLDLARTSQLVSRSLFISHLVTYNLFARNKFHAYNNP